MLKQLTLLFAIAYLLGLSPSPCKGGLPFSMKGFFFSCKCTSKARLDGKTAIITGSNAGIGKYTALDLYTRGAKVIMACRDVAKAEAARDWIKQQCEGKNGLGQLTVTQLDLSSLASVRQCARKILEEESQIHILINNAGLKMTPRSLSKDGYELQFATNHLGHFLFTLMLLPTIISAAPARIVNVASLLHVTCNSLHFEDINLEKSYSPMRAYGRSKMATILFTRELASRLKGKGVTVYSLHPGVVNTPTQNLDQSMFPGAQWMTETFGKLFFKNPQQGAQTTLYCAVDEGTAKETGLYYDNCKAVTPVAMARDDKLAKQLWDVSLEMVKHNPPAPFGKSSS